MKFFFADNCDTVDPDFDFETERTNVSRNRRYDLFPHEVFEEPPYDGILISRALLFSRKSSRLSQAQRYAILREGLRNYLRYPREGFDGDVGKFPIMGDSGAFSYVNETVPPVTAEELVSFYRDCGVQYGVAPDHIITGLSDDWDDRYKRPSVASSRFEITLSLAREFVEVCRQESVTFTPIGSLQFWSAKSAVKAARSLVDMGYDYLGLGGVATARTDDILRLVSEVREAIPADVRLHLFGFNRTDHLERFHSLGVTSFDSTSPMLKAIKDDQNNYFSNEERSFTAIRIPPATEEVIGRRIKSGQLDVGAVETAEKRALKAVKGVANRDSSVEGAMESLRAYDQLLGRHEGFEREYLRTLERRPWERCPCAICRQIGVEVILHRGLNRHKRRGFHNLWVFHQRLQNIRSLHTMKVPCLRISQPSGRSIYSFAINGKEIAKFATVSRIGRSDEGKLLGYQRPEIDSHIEEIREYLDGQESMLPNALILAFNQPLQFSAEREEGEVSVGTLDLPVGEKKKPALVVDGQQRFAALRKARRTDLVVPVTAIESSGQDDERQQFVLINNTRPLPKSLVYELLPSIGDKIPARLKTRQEAYRVLQVLESDSQSPFFRRIKTMTSIHQDTANIKDVSILRMIENSSSNGVLAQWPDSIKRRARFLKSFWSAVQLVFPDAWLLPPRESRLTHGVGIVSMGFLMDSIAFRVKREGRDWSTPEFKLELERVKPFTAWINGDWNFASNMILPWDGLQNTTRDIDQLTSFLIRQYLAETGSQ